jgi:hypothetical protein
VHHLNTRRLPDHVLALVLVRYARLYFSVSRAVCRAREIEADRTAVRVAGSAAAAGALRQTTALRAAWQVFVDHYVTMAWDAGYLPDRVLDGFTALLADPDRQCELAGVRRDLHTEPVSDFDSHPPTAQRVAGMEAMRVTTGRPDGDRPAVALVAAATGALDAVFLAGLVEEATAKRRVDWAALATIGGRAAAVRQADPLLAAAEGGTLGAVLDALDAGRVAELGVGLVDPPAGMGRRALRELSRQPVARALFRLVTVALVDAGHARWQLSWSSGAPLLIDDPFDDGLAELVDAAVGDGSTAALRQRSRTREWSSTTAPPTTWAERSSQPEIPPVPTGRTTMASSLLGRFVKSVRHSLGTPDAPPPARRPAPPVDPTTFGLVPNSELTAEPLDDRPIGLAVAAAKAGDWRPAAAALAEAGTQWDRRSVYVGRLGKIAADDDSWLLAWQRAQPDNPDHAVVLADSLFKLAWNVRGGHRATQTSRDQFAGFHRILADAERAARHATEVAPDDPTPWYALATIARGLEFDNDRFRGVWRELVARDPHHRRGHESALQYWCAKWFGSDELMREFADTAAAAAPSLGILPLVAAYELAQAHSDQPQYTSPWVATAVDRLTGQWLAGPGFTSVFARHDRGWASFVLVRAGRPSEAVEQFRLIGRHVDVTPYANYTDPVATFVLSRDRACRGA